MFLETLKKDEETESKPYQYFGTIIWYLVFILLIPFFLKKEKYLRIFLPMVDLIANVFSSAGKGKQRLFKDLYKLTPNNIISFLSTNFINLIALFGVALNGSYYILKHQNKWLGIKVMLIMYTITYLLPTQGLNWSVLTIQSYIDSFRNDTKDTSFIKHIKIFMRKYPKIFDYMGGIIIIFILVSLESYIITIYLNMIDKNL